MSDENKYSLISKDYSASEITEECMLEYILNVSENKLPNIIDGLKSVHRRFLYSAKDKTGFTDTQGLVADGSKLHTAGSSSMSKAAIRLNQPFSMGVNLTEIHGNRGFYNSQNGGADRYTTIKISDIARDLFFNQVKMKTIPMKMNEKYTGTEPVYFIPRLPSSLLIYTLTIGAGIKSVVLPLNLTSVTDLVKFYIDNSDKFGVVNYNEIVDRFVPNFPIKNYIRNFHNLLDSYKQNNFNESILVEGLVDISRNSFNIKTMPFSIEFSNSIESMTEVIKANKYKLFGEDVSFQNLTHEFSEADIVLSFKRNVNIFNIFEKYKKLIRYNSGVSPIYNFCDDKGFVHNLTPPILIDKWIQERRKSIKAGIKYEQNETYLSIAANHTRLLLDSDYDEIMGIIRDRDLNKEQIFSKLIDRFKLSKTQCKILTGTDILSTSQTSKEDIEKDLERLNNKVNYLNDNLKNVDDIIYKDCEYFANNYGKKYPKITKIDSYLGYIQTSDFDIVQFDDLKEAVRLLSEFPDSKCYTYRYKSNDRKLVISTKGSKSDNIYPSKITKAYSLLDTFSNENHTLWISKDKVKYTTKETLKFQTDLISRDVPITEKFYGITNAGEIVPMNVDKLVPIGKKNSIQANLISAVPRDIFKEGIVLIMMNDGDPNIINFIHLDKNNKNIRLPLTGDNIVIGYVSVMSDKPYIFNLPDFTIHQFKYLRIDNTKKLPNGEFKLNRNIKRNDVIKSMIEF